MRKSQLIAGVLSIGIYIAIIGILVIYFNNRDYHKAKKYVIKNDNRIQVSLASIKTPIKDKTKKIKEKSKVKSKHIVKKVFKKKKIKAKISDKQIKKQITKKKYNKTKRVIHKKIVKKDVNSTKIKKRQTSNLFADIKVPKKHNILVISDKPLQTKPKNDMIKLSDKKPSALEKINNSLRKQKNMDKGVTNIYLAKVQEMLEDWPAQSDFAGQSVKVLLYIKPSGMFEFEIKSASTNPEFNQSLIEYLKQLQIFGFGKHQGNKVYKFEADFVAKE